MARKRIKRILQDPESYGDVKKYVISGKSAFDQFLCAAVDASFAVL